MLIPVWRDQFHTQTFPVKADDVIKPVSDYDNWHVRPSDKVSVIDTYDGIVETYSYYELRKWMLSGLICIYESTLDTNGNIQFLRLRSLFNGNLFIKDNKVYYKGKRIMTFEKNDILADIHISGVILKDGAVVYGGKGVGPKFQITDVYIRDAEYLQGYHILRFDVVLSGEEFGNEDACIAVKAVFDKNKFVGVLGINCKALNGSYNMSERFSISKSLRARIGLAKIETW